LRTCGGASPGALAANGQAERSEPMPALAGQRPADGEESPNRSARYGSVVSVVVLASSCCCSANFVHVSANFNNVRLELGSSLVRASSEQFSANSRYRSHASRTRPDLGSILTNSGGRRVVRCLALLLVERAEAISRASPSEESSATPSGNSAISRSAPPIAST
jgi:hypothetical protein